MDAVKVNYLPNPCYTISEEAFYDIQQVASEIRLLHQLVQRPKNSQILVSSSDLETMLASIDEILSRALAQAAFQTH